MMVPDVINGLLMSLNFEVRLVIELPDLPVTWSAHYSFNIYPITFYLDWPEGATAEITGWKKITIKASLVPGLFAIVGAFL